MKRALLLLVFLAAPPAAQARDFTSSVSEGNEILRLRPEFKTPDEPNQLFYIQRSPNSNTVVYAARLDSHGDFDPKAPVEAFWRKFNIDGSKQKLNFMERMMAYGVQMDTIRPGQPISFRVAALPDRKLTLAMDAQHHPEALLQVDGHTVKLAYVYLQVVEGGLLPSVPSLDIFGTDIASGKAIHEHLIQK
ncbi:MAG TPA: DUF4833 domain-containing protein [Rhizomicrobium sp.]|jgi:hypothetical protein|nr:DUF4833 domain-containing protein [Rhizomicrobium sp.]